MSASQAADLAVFPHLPPVIEPMQPPVIEVRDLVSWSLGPYSESAGDGTSDWRGILVVDSVVSRMIGLGLLVVHLLLVNTL